MVAGEGGVDLQRGALPGYEVVVAGKGVGGVVLDGLGGGDVVGGVDGVEVEARGGFADGLVGLGVLGEGDEGSARAEDAGLFAGDGGNGVAEVVLVVEGD